MTKKGNTRFIYSKALGEKIPVSEEEYREFYREVGRIRKNEQYYGRCTCPKQFIWSCDGDCDICEYHRSATLSLDAANTDDGANLYDSQLTAAASMENIIEDCLLLEQLFQRLRELDPDADRIVAMWEENPKTSDRKIAEALGRPQRTFASQMKKIRRELRKIRGY